MALGWTENYSDGPGERYVVRTDSAGQIAGCDQIHADANVTLDP